MSRALKPVDDGTRVLTRGDAPSVSDASAVIAELLALCPEGHHPWRVEVQKSSKGRRAHVTVTFQRNRMHVPRREDL